MIILLVIAVVVLMFVIKFQNVKRRAEIQLIETCWTNETEIKARGERFLVAMGEAADRADRLVVAENFVRDLQLLLNNPSMPSDSWFKKQAIEAEVSWSKEHGL